MHTCQFINAVEMLRVFSEGPGGYIRAIKTQRRPKDAVCGKPANRELAFKANLDPFRLCAEHYDLLIGEGRSALPMPSRKPD
jgi:hypothetical protein